MTRRLNWKMTCLGWIACLGLTKTLHAQSGSGKGYENIPEGAYSVLAEVQARPGKTEELRKATLPLIQLVRSDPTNLVYFFQEDRERPGHFLFYEIFSTKDDFEAHNNQPYVRTWFAKLPQLTINGVSVTRMTVLKTMDTLE
jgi:quinol monooxygenase YgiN